MIRTCLSGVLLMLSALSWPYEWFPYPEFSQRLCINEPQKVSTFFVVGDSMVDTGNFYNYSRFLEGSGDLGEQQQALYPWSGRNIPGFLYSSMCGALPGGNYHDGRFCDGLIATELVAEALDLNTSNKTEFVDLSHGGSSVVGFYDVLTDFIQAYWHGNTQQATFDFIINIITGGKPLLSSVEDQVDYMVAYYAPFSEGQIMMLAGGANDYLNHYWNYSLVISKLVAAIEKLYANGARTIIWGTVPDVSKTPCLRQSEDRQAVHEAVAGHNRLAIKEFYRLRRKYPDLLLLFFDNNRMFDIFLEDARKQGVDVDNPCLNITFKGCSDEAPIDICDSHKASACENAGDHFYFDSSHPSSMVQKWIFNFSCRMLTILNYNVQCPKTDLKREDELLLRYFTEESGYLEKDYTRLIFNGECPVKL